MCHEKKADQILSAKGILNSEIVKKRVTEIVIFFLCACVCFLCQQSNRGERLLHESAVQNTLRNTTIYSEYHHETPENYNWTEEL